MTQGWHVYQASEAQKKNQMADHRQELFSPEFLQGFAPVSLKFFFSSLRCACWKASPKDNKNITPTLAAQSAFPFGPLSSFHKIFGQRIWQ
jgi:hypothetical protein